MKSIRLFRNIFPAYHKLDVPVLYSASHFLLTSIFMLLALVPIYVMVTGYFGYKVLILLGAGIGTGLLTELAGIRITGKYTGYFGFMSWALFPLILPPGLDLWISLVCFILATIICIVFFGGYGHHIFHPVVVAQVFVMINFVASFTQSFTKPFFDFSFGFHSYSAFQITEDTTFAALKIGKFIPGIELFFGPNVGFYSDAFPYILLVSGITYLIFGGVNRKTPLSFLAGMLLFSFLGNLVLPQMIYPLPQTLLGGSTLFYAFFIFSDRFTSQKSGFGRICAGFVAALLTILMRAFSIYNEAIMFAALFNFAFGPLYDELGFKFLNKKALRIKGGKDTVYAKVEG